MARRGVLQVHKCREMLSLPWRFESLWLVKLRLPNASHPRCVGYADMPHSQANDLEPTAGRKLSPVTTHAGHCMQLPTTGYPFLGHSSASFCRRPFNCRGPLVILGQINHLSASTKPTAHPPAPQFSHCHRKNKDDLSSWLIFKKSPTKHRAGVPLGQLATRRLKSPCIPEQGTYMAAILPVP